MGLKTRPLAPPPKGHSERSASGVEGSLPSSRCSASGRSSPTLRVPALGPQIAVQAAQARLGRGYVQSRAAHLGELLSLAHHHGGVPCHVCGTTIERKVIRNRGSYFCTKCQPEGQALRLKGG